MPGSQLRKHRILVVEDEAIIGLHISSTLGQFGYDVVGVAISADEAIRMAGELGPDLILMDIVIPGERDGIDAARVLKDTLGLPVVYLTGNADVTTVTRARETNPYGYVLKPVNPQDLFSTIDTALHRHELEKRLKESEEKLRRLTDNMTDMVSQVDREGRIIWASPSHGRVMGYQMEEILGHRPLEIVHPDDQAMIQEQYRKGMEERTDTRTEYRGLHRDGRYIWLETVNSYLYTAGGDFDGAIFSSRDISERKRAEALHRESEEKYRALVETTDTGYVIVDPDGSVIDANREYVRLTGHAGLGEILGRSVIEWTAPHDRERNVAAVRQCFRDGFIRGFEIDYVDGAGNITPIEINATVAGSGAVARIHTLCRDISWRRKAEEELQKNEERFRGIALSISDWIWEIDENLICTYVSDRVTALMGYTRGELVGRSPFELVPPDEFERLKVNGFIMVESHEPYRDFEIWNIAKDGRRVCILSSGVPMFDGKGTFRGYRGVNRDITNRKRIEALLMEKEEQFSALFELSSAGIFMYDVSLKVTDCNQQFADILKTKRDLLIGLDLNLLREREIVDRLVGALSGVKGTYKGPYRATTTGAVPWIFSSVSPLHGPGGEIVGGLGVVVDITDMVMAGGSAREREELYRAVFGQSPVGIFTYNRDMVLTDSNARFAAILESSIEKLVGLDLKRLRDTAVIPSLEEAIRGNVANYEGPYHATTSDAFRWVRFSVSPLRGPDGSVTGGIGVVVDITDRKTAEEALRESEERYRDLIDNANDLIYNVDFEGRFISFNKKALAVTGYSAEEARHMTVDDIVAPEYLDLVREMMKEKIMGGGPTTYDVEIFAKDGRRIQLEINTQLILDRGRPVSLQGIGREITGRKQKEDRIRASLKEKEMLLREVHHRVKNNFQVITSLMSLQSAGIQNPELRKSFMDAQNRIRSMSLIHEKFYQSEDLHRLDISSYIHTIVQELYSTFADSRTIEPRVDVGDIRLNVDQAIPCGLIVNELLTNAFKYAFPPGWEGPAEIQVSIRNSGGMIEMVIGDNGTGLPPSVDLNATSSLGLTLVPLLVTQLEGTIELERERGTRYSISFPAK